MKLNEPGRQNSFRQNFWQHTKHTTLYLPVQGLKWEPLIVLCSEQRGFFFIIFNSVSWIPDRRERERERELSLIHI